MQTFLLIFHYELCKCEGIKSSSILLVGKHEKEWQNWCTDIQGTTQYMMQAKNSEWDKREVTQWQLPSVRHFVLREGKKVNIHLRCRTEKCTVHKEHHHMFLKQSGIKMSIEVLRETSTCYKCTIPIWKSFPEVDLLLFTRTT